MPFTENLLCARPGVTSGILTDLMLRKPYEMGVGFFFLNLF